MKKKGFTLGAMVLVLSLLFSSTTVFAYNSDLPANAGRYYAFNQFFMDHFAGCANGAVNFLSTYPAPAPNTTTPLASALPADRMMYIANNNWIPIAAYSPLRNVMSFYFAGEQELFDFGDLTNDNIQLDPACRHQPLSYFVTKAHSKSDIKAISDMSKTARSFDFYLDYVPNAALAGRSADTVKYPLSPIYDDIGSYFNLFESKQINVTVGAGAVLRLSAPVKLGSLILKEGATLDLTGLKVNDLPGFNSLDNISSNGGKIVFPASATEKDREKFLKKVVGYVAA